MGEELTLHLELPQPINKSYLIESLMPLDRGSIEDLRASFIYALQFGDDEMAEKYFQKLLDSDGKNNNNENDKLDDNSNNNDNKNDKVDDNKNVKVYNNKSNNKNKFNFTVPVSAPNKYHGDAKDVEIVTSYILGSLSPINVLVTHNESLFINHEVPYEFRLKWLTRLFDYGARVKDYTVDTVNHINMYNHSTLCCAISNIINLIPLEYQKDKFEIIKLLLSHGAAQYCCKMGGKQSIICCLANKKSCYYFPELYYLLIICGSDPSFNYRFTLADKLRDENKIYWCDTAGDILFKSAKEVELLESDGEFKSYTEHTKQVLHQFKRGLIEMRREFLSMWLSFSYPKELCGIIFNYLAWSVY